jgi:hypothetical protein
MQPGISALNVQAEPFVQAQLLGAPAFANAEALCTGTMPYDTY